MRSSLGWNGFHTFAQFRPGPFVMLRGHADSSCRQHGVDLQEPLAKGRLPFGADIRTGDLSGIAGMMRPAYHSPLSRTEAPALIMAKAAALLG